MNTYEALQRLRKETVGSVLLPGDPGYSAATTLWNLAVSHQPVGVLLAASASDVEAAVRCAVAQDLPVVVAATGHGAASSDTATSRSLAEWFGVSPCVTEVA